MNLEFIRKLLIPTLFIILSLMLINLYLPRYKANILLDTIENECTNKVLLKWDPVDDTDASYKIFVKSDDVIALFGETKDTQYTIYICDKYDYIGVSAFYSSENDESTISWIPIGDPKPIKFVTAQ